LNLDGRIIRDLRLVLSAAVDRPVRLSQTEAALRGGTIGEPLLKRAVEACLGEVDIDSDSRGSAEYKRHLLAVHLRRAVDAMAAEQQG
jgi:carbon-monoxide dehydrogenase medium subunit